MPIQHTLCVWGEEYIGVTTKLVRIRGSKCKNKEDKLYIGVQANTFGRDVSTWTVTIHYVPFSLVKIMV